MKVKIASACVQLWADHCQLSTTLALFCHLNNRHFFQNFKSFLFLCKYFTYFFSIKVYNQKIISYQIITGDNMDMDNELSLYCTRGKYSRFQVPTVTSILLSCLALNTASSPSTFCITQPSFSARTTKSKPLCSGPIL